MSNQNIFNQVQLKKPSTNVFDLSYDHKLSLDMGKLVPVHVMDVVPGDKITMGCHSMLRFAPMLAPIMHKVDVYTHFFFVPNRLTWAGWEDFVTKEGLEQPAAPYIKDFGVTTGQLGDYLGLPVNPLIDKASALPFAAYQCIYNEYYRDQNLQNEINYKLVDGDNTLHNWGELYPLRQRAWQHDYFTSALPWAQKGEPVTLPISGDAIVNFKSVGNTNTAVTIEGTGVNNATVYNPLIPVWNDSEVPDNRLYANLDSANSVTINDLRRAIKLQEYLERDAVGGTRYTEWIRSHFGVVSSDARLQRPEYLGGTKSPVVISEVLQTSESSESPQGNMAGHGISVGSGRAFSYYAEEHGYIIGIMSILPKTAYQQGIPRHFSRWDKFDYFVPEFAHIGEQPILNRELFYHHTDGQNNAVFGYTPRYSEYKYMDSRVSGLFRTDLNYWHMGRIFSARPNLNSNFITSDPTTRIFAVTDEPQTIYAHVYHDIKATRKMPYFGTPSF